MPWQCTSVEILCTCFLVLQSSESFWNKMRQLNTHKGLRKDSAYAFDSAWVVALALNASFANGMQYDQLLNRKYSQVFAIRKGIENTNFQGITVSARVFTSLCCKSNHHQLNLTLFISRARVKSQEHVSKKWKNIPDIFEGYCKRKRAPFVL